MFSNWILYFLNGLLLCFLWSAPLSAQQVWFTNDLSMHDNQTYYLVGKYKQQVLLYQDNDESNQKVFAYNQQMRNAWDKELDLGKGTPKVIEVQGRKQDFFVFFSYRRKGRLYLKYHKYDPAANLRDSMTTSEIGSMLATPDFKVLFSEDRSKACLYYTEYNRYLYAFVLDLDQRKELWHKEIQVDQWGDFPDFDKKIIDNQGNLYFLYDRFNKRNKKEEHELVLWKCTGEGTPAILSIPMRSRLTYDVKMAIDNFNGTVILAGIYSEDSRAEANGYFRFKAPQNALPEFELVMHPFQKEFLTTFHAKEKPTEEGMENMEVMDIVLRKDGGFLLVLEKNREIERYTSGIGQNSPLFPSDIRRFNADFYSEDVALLSIHPDGTVHWQNVLRKKQYSQDDGAVFSSYFLVKTATNLRFFFNDDIRNGSTVSQYIVSADGEIKRTSVLNTTNKDLQLRFRESMQTGTQEFIIPSERRNRLRLVLLQLE